VPDQGRTDPSLQIPEASTVHTIHDGGMVNFSAPNVKSLGRRAAKGGEQVTSHLELGIRHSYLHNQAFNNNT
jgi:hypothetical protein